MQLSDYLTFRKLTASKFAAAAGVPPSTIIRLLKGERSPTIDLLSKIKRATGGAVTPNDFLQDGAPVKGQSEQTKAAAE